MPACRTADDTRPPVPLLLHIDAPLFAKLLIVVDVLPQTGRGCLPRPRGAARMGRYPSHLRMGALRDDVAHGHVLEELHDAAKWLRHARPIIVHRLDVLQKWPAFAEHEDTQAMVRCGRRHAPLPKATALDARTIEAAKEPWDTSPNAPAWQQQCHTQPA